MSYALQQIQMKRIYARPARTDGTRVLVDRLWPRGLNKQRAAVDIWLRDLAPSNELRRWFHAYPQSWQLFHKRYLKELRKPEAANALTELYWLAEQPKRLTLLFASKNEEHNNAAVLRNLLLGMRKPPTGTGPGALRAMRHRQLKRMPR